MKKAIVFFLAICLLVVCPYIALARVVPQGAAAGMTASEAGDYASLQTNTPHLPLLTAGGGSAWAEIGVGVVLVVLVIVVAAVVMSGS